MLGSLGVGESDTTDAAGGSEQGSERDPYDNIRKYSYAKGFSGNVEGGRKKGPLERELERMCNDAAVAVRLARALIAVACNPKSKGCVPAQKLIRDRISGPVLRELADKWSELPDIVLELTDRVEDDSVLPALPHADPDTGTGEGAAEASPSPSVGSPTSTPPAPDGEVSRIDPLDELDTSQSEG